MRDSELRALLRRAGDEIPELDVAESTWVRGRTARRHRWTARVVGGLVAASVVGVLGAQVAGWPGQDADGGVRVAGAAGDGPQQQLELPTLVGEMASVAEREAASGIQLCVENMFPWRAGRKGGQRRELEAYLPHWDPVPQPYAHVTLDLSHTATAGSDALAMADELGERLRHIHLADGLGSVRDEHLVPGRGNQPCGELLETMAGRGFDGSIVVEVGTRKLTPEQREIDLAEALAFARLHFAAAPTPSS